MTALRERLMLVSHDLQAVHVDEMDAKAIPTMTLRSARMGVLAAIDEIPDPLDVLAVLNGHDTDADGNYCAWFNGGGGDCSCPYEAAAERIQTWLDRQGV